MIAWTYDPLIRRNAYFNLVKLGARPVEYLRNFYGTMDDAINGGTETDRMLVHWDLRSDLAVAACAGQVRPASFGAERDRGAVVALSADRGGAPLDGLALDGPAPDGARTSLSACPPTSRRCGCRIPRSPARGAPRCATCCRRCSAAAGG